MNPSPGLCNRASGNSEIMPTSRETLAAVCKLTIVAARNLFRPIVLKKSGYDRPFIKSKNIVLSYAANGP